MWCFNGFHFFFCPLTNLHKLCLFIIRCEQLRRSRVRTRSNPSGGNLKLIPLDLLNKNLVRPRLQFQIRTVAITCRTWTPPCFSAAAAALPERPFFSSIHRSTRLLRLGGCSWVLTSSPPSGACPRWPSVSTCQSTITGMLSINKKYVCVFGPNQICICAIKSFFCISVFGPTRLCPSCLQSVQPTCIYDACIKMD